MSQQIPLTNRPHAYQVTLTANPKAQPQKPGGATSHITATVVDPRTRRPVAGVKVTFSASVAQASFTSRKAITDHRGIATTRLTYPHPAQGEYGGGGLVDIYASTPNGGDALQLIFYSKGLQPVYITNLKPGHIIDHESIAAGVQAVVYPWPGTELGYIYTLYWGENSVQRAFDGHNFPWVVDIAKVFKHHALSSNGIYDVFYEVRDIVGNVADCKPVEVKIKTAPHIAPTLLMPTLPSIQNDIIDYATAKTGLHIIIPGNQPAVEPDSQYRLFLNIKSHKGNAIKQILIGQGPIIDDNSISVPVSYADLQDCNGANAEIYYEINRPGEQEPLLSSINQVNIDIAPPELI